MNFLCLGDMWYKSLIYIQHVFPPPNCCHLIWPMVYQVKVDNNHAFYKFLLFSSTFHYSRPQTAHYLPNMMCKAEVTGSLIPTVAKQTQSVEPKKKKNCHQTKLQKQF